MAQHPCCSKTPLARLQGADGRPSKALQTPSPRCRPAGRWTSPTGPAARFAPAAAVAAAVLALLGGLQMAGPPAELPDAGVELALAEPEEGGMTDASMGDTWASLPIPAKPGPTQETRCNPKRGEVRINGGCYLELSAKPPCLEGQYVHDGKCYVAVGKREQPAQSVGQ